MCSVHYRCTYFSEFSINLVESIPTYVIASPHLFRGNTLAKTLLGGPNFIQHGPTLESAPPLDKPSHVMSSPKFPMIYSRVFFDNAIATLFQTWAFHFALCCIGKVLKVDVLEGRWRLSSIKDNGLRWGKTQ